MEPQRVTILDGPHKGEEGVVVQQRTERGCTEVWVKPDGDSQLVVQRAESTPGAQRPTP